MKLKIAVIIVNYHGLSDTLACLDSLKKVKSANEVKIYVVNEEDETEAEAIRKHSLKPEVIHAEDNLGFSGANNLGIEKAIADKADYLIFLNNDTTVEPNFIDPLIKKLQAGAAMVSPLIYFYPGNEFHHEAYTPKEQGKVVWYAGGIIDWQNVYAYHWGVDEVDHGQFRAAETDFATGCCLAVARETVVQIGTLDESYFLYLEDVEWSLRARKAGGHIWFEPASKVFHKNAGSTGGSGSETHVYYQTRNRLRFGMRWAPLRTKQALMREALHQLRLKELSQSQKQGVLDGLLGKRGKRR